MSLPVLLLASLGGGTAAYWLMRGVLSLVDLHLHKPAPPPTRYEECERCGEVATHRVVSTGDDDERLGISQGGTMMSADFCAEHCPGRCLQGCARLSA